MPAPRTTTRQVAPRRIPVPKKLPAIGAAFAGGLYAGLTLHDGKLHALVLLPGERESVDWKTATAWAKRKRGVLPSRFDQLVLFDGLKGQFQADWYWSGTRHAGDESYAWSQLFLSVYQYGSIKSSQLRARAVRRVAI